MSIWLKLTLPLLGLIGIVMLYMIYVWMPYSADISSQQSQRQIHKTLDTVGEGLVPLLLVEQLDSIYQNLDALSKKHPEWVYLSLTNSKGQSLYPFEEKEFPVLKESFKRIENPIMSGEDVIGNLTLIYDFSSIIKETRQNGERLLVLIIGMLLLLGVVMGGILHHYVIKPVNVVSKAAKALVENKGFIADFVAPKAADDEIGRMVNSFVYMRTETLNTQKNINQINVDLAASAYQTEIANKNLDSERARLNAILNNMMQGVITIDEKGIIKSFNKLAEDIFGHPAQDIIGQNVSVLMPEPDSGHHDEYLRNYMLGGKPKIIGQERFVKGLKKDGTTFSMALSVAEIISGEERIFIGMVQDITMDLEKEKSLVQFKKTLDQTQDCIFMFRPDPLKLFYVNKGAMEQVGYTRKELYTIDPYDIMEEYSGVLFRGFVEQLITAEEKQAEFESLHRHKDGHFVPVAISLQYFEFDDDEPHFMAVVRDVSAEKEAKKKILAAMKRAREARHEADRANEAKGQFLANMSHELRTPMNGIIGLAGLLLGSNLKDDEHEIMNSIHSSGLNLLSLLNDILDFSKIEAGELSFENMPYDPRSILAENINTLAPLASKKSIILEQTCSAQLPAFIMGDGHRFRQVLYNLVGNAIKFTRHGYVRTNLDFLPAKEGKGELILTVRDTGIGIPQDKLETIFQKLSQADVSTTRQYGGTGLGLTICKQIIELMGGEISVESTVGEGSVFCFKLPVIEADVQGAGNSERSEDADESVSFEGYSVLIVDDHPINILFAKKLMANWKFSQIETAESGKRALEAFGKNNFDVILMDCQMPDMDGFEASQKIREIEERNAIQKPVYILAMTADAMQGVKEKCLNSGMNGYITKPVIVEKLRKALQENLAPKAGTSTEEKTCSKDSKNSKDKDEQPDGDHSSVDLSNLDFYTDGDMEIEREFVETFYVSAQESIEILQNAAKDMDHDTWRAEAHKFKGAAATLGARQIAHLCLQIEDNAVIPDDADSVTEHMIRELDVVMAYMRKRQQA